MENSVSEYKVASHLCVSTRSDPVRILGLFSYTEFIQCLYTVHAPRRNNVNMGGFWSAGLHVFMCQNCGNNVSFSGTVFPLNRSPPWGSIVSVGSTARLLLVVGGGGFY